MRSQFPRKQQGLSFIGWLFVIGLVLAFALAAIRIAPIYMENATVKAALRSLKEKHDIRDDSSSEILTLIQRRLDINNVKDIGRDNIVIKKDPSSLYVAISYEVRKPLVGNLDIIASFDEELELSFR
jgi:hypothetical protein